MAWQSVLRIPDFGNYGTGPATFVIDLQDAYKKKQFFLSFPAFFLFKGTGTFTSFFQKK
jgi:hypothetical protein